MNTSNTESNKQRDSLIFSFEYSRQLLTLAIGGIGFLIGLHYSTNITLASTTLFWLALITFGLSTIFGLLVFMRGTGIVYGSNSYDVYEPVLRTFSLLQILMLVLGVTLLCVQLKTPTTKTSSYEMIQIKVNDHTMNYPLRPNEAYNIEINNGHLKFTTVNK
jgi:hypothetical protein